MLNPHCPHRNPIPIRPIHIVERPILAMRRLDLRPRQAPLARLVVEVDPVGVRVDAPRLAPVGLGRELGGAREPAASVLFARRGRGLLRHERFRRPRAHGAVHPDLR